MKILVGYASAHGSTAEIAEFIGNELSQRGFDVTVGSVANITSVDPYDAFVLGSAIHDGMWLTPMLQFFTQYQERLQGKPLAFFITCIRVMEKDGFMHVMEDYMHQRLLEKMDVRAITAFAGRLHLESVNWDDRWTLAATYDGTQPVGMFNNDFRDWEVIRGWVGEVADAFNV